MNVLIGCEYSATVREEFAKLGHDAWSCDLLESDKLGQHIQGDIAGVIYGGSWDLIILHPPCTGMGLCGNRWYGKGTPKHAERIAALDWTEALWKLAKEWSPKVALEQPRSVLCQRLGKCTQEIQPWQFGHPEQKATWLWLHNLPALTPTKNVYAEMMLLPKREREREFFTCRLRLIADMSVRAPTRESQAPWPPNGASPSPHRPFARDNPPSTF